MNSDGKLDRGLLCALLGVVSVHSISMHNQEKDMKYLKSVLQQQVQERNVIG